MKKKIKSEELKGRLKDLVPPGAKTPHGKGAPTKPNTTPGGGPTTANADGLKPRKGPIYQVDH